MSKFDIGEMVLFENKFYIIRKILFLNPNLGEDGLVCSLSHVTDPREYSTDQILVRENLLEKLKRVKKD